MSTTPLRVAVPNKGTLSDAAVDMLVEAGYAGRPDTRALSVPDEKNGVEFYFLRPRDIATYVGQGALDVGITGRDLLLDSDAPAREVQALDFGFSTFRFAGPPGMAVEDLSGKTVATSYPHLVGTFLTNHGVDAETVRLDGAVESACAWVWPMRWQMWSRPDEHSSRRGWRFLARSFWNPRPCSLPDQRAPRVLTHSSNVCRECWLPGNTC